MHNAEFDCNSKISDFYWGAAFSCAGLTSFTISNTITSIIGIQVVDGELVFKGITPWISCEHLASIEVPQDNPYFTSVDGVLFDKRMTQLLYYPQGKQGSYEIPSTVQIIHHFAFANCEFTSIVVPPSSSCHLRCQENSVPGACPLIMPDSVHSIAEFAFLGALGWERSQSPTQSVRLRKELSSIVDSMKGIFGLSARASR